MLSAIILVDPAATEHASACLRDVAKTLAALVSYVVADLVADACIVAPPGLDFAPIKTSSGCRVILDRSFASALSRAADQARRERLLLLRQGYAPDANFGDEIVSVLEASPDEPRALRAQAQTFLQRVWPALLPTAALVCPRTAVSAGLLDEPITLDRLAARLRARPLRTAAIRLSSEA